MRNRQQHETDTGHLPSGGGMTGAQRRAEIRDIADQLGLAPLTAPRTHQILLTAAPAAGLTAVKACAAERAASRFAHGRYWPNLRASQPRAVIPGDDGVHTVAFILDEDQHRPLADYCHVMLGRLQEHYTARAQDGYRCTWLSWQSERPPAAAVRRRRQAPTGVVPCTDRAAGLGPYT